MDEEGLKETPNKLIHIGTPIDIDKNFFDKLDELINYEQSNSIEIEERVAEVVSTYKIDKRNM